MNEPPPLAAEIEALKEAYAALNRNDIEGFVKNFDPEIVRVEPEGFPTSGTYRGLQAVKEQVTRGRSTWAEGSCDPERFLIAGDKVVVYVHVRVRLKDQTEWVDAPVTDVFTFRDGKVVDYRSFAETQEALSWAGAEDSNELAG
jgi:ketosteroid isomerase-like protein